MYVSNNLLFKLDEIIKSFEVALRSYLLTSLQKKFKNENELKEYLINLQKTQQSSSIMLSSKIESTIKDFIKNYKDLYNFIINTTNSTMIKDYHNDEVPYVSQLISLIILFFKEFTEFKDLTKNYSTIEEFNYQIFLYHRIRNDLSHPGSKKILKNDASSVIKLLIKFMEVIDDTYFWFVSKNKINDNISLYYKEEKSKILKYDNLKNMNVSHQKTICRESELNFLHKCILGETEYSRVAGSIVIYGYGGVGKTALVVDFIYEIIQKMQSENNDALYDFIFFFSTKEEMLTTSNTTGEFYIDKIDYVFCMEKMVDDVFKTAA